MEAYKSTCAKCGQTYFWQGRKTSLGASEKEMAEMKKDRTVCRYCGSDGLQTDLDYESPAGQVYDAQAKLIVEVLGEIFSDRPHKT